MAAEPEPGVIARAIRARRIELDLSVEDAAIDARVHVTMWRLLEQGVTEPSPLMLRAVSRVLGWTPATIESLRQGEMSVDGEGDIVVDLDQWPDHEPVAIAPPPDAVTTLDAEGLTPAQLAEVQRFIDELRGEH